MSVKTFFLLCLQTFATIPALVFAQKEERPKPLKEADPELLVNSIKLF